MPDLQLSSRFIHNRGAGVPTVLLLGASCVTEHGEAVTAIGSYTAALVARYNGIPVLIMCRLDSLGAPVDSNLLLRQSDAREVAEGWTERRANNAEAGQNVQFLAQATSQANPVLQISNFSFDSVSPDLVSEYLTEVRVSVPILSVEAHGGGMTARTDDA